MDYSGSGDRWAWDYITPKRRQGLYLVYKRDFCSCQLSDYILPIPPFKRTFNNPLIGDTSLQIAPHYQGIFVVGYLPFAPASHGFLKDL